jgi:glycosyltransferase involved in cell wall biosynthesis
VGVGAKGLCMTELVFPVSVVTPSIGREELHRACISVRDASRTMNDGMVEHVIVVDGPQHEERVRAIVARLTSGPLSSPLYHPVVVVLPFATKRSGGICRAVGSMLARGTYQCFLDDDNWFAESHLLECVRTMSANPGYHWMHTARFYVNAAGGANDEIFEDLSDSLGLLNTVWYSRWLNHVDTNCFFIKRELAQKLAPHWFVDPLLENWGEDRVYFSQLLWHGGRHMFLFKPTVYYLTRPEHFKAVPHGNHLIDNSSFRYRNQLMHYRFTLLAALKVSLVTHLWRFVRRWRGTDTKWQPGGGTLGNVG